MSSVSLYGSHLLFVFCSIFCIFWLFLVRAPSSVCVSNGIPGDCVTFFFFLTSWVLGEWTPCSVTCGDGIQTRDLTCKQEISATLTMRVNEAACLGAAPLVPRVRNCNLGHCAKWHTSDWGKVRIFFSCFSFFHLHFSHSPHLCVIYQRD